MAGPWQRPKGSVFIASGTDFFEARGNFLFDAPPLVDGLDDFSRFSTSTYAEYGLTDQWQAIFKITYTSAIINTEFSRSQSDGLGEIEGSIQRSLFKNEKSALGVSISAGRQNNLGAGVRPQLASDGIDGEIRILYGRTLKSKGVKVFSTAEIAWRRRFGIAADQIRTDIKIGIEPHNRILVLFDAFNTFSLRNQDENGPDFDVLKLQPSIALRVYKKWRFQTGANFEVAGRNLALGRSIFINLWSEF